MDCKNCSDNSSTSYSRCNPPISSNCAFYQGSSLTCEHDDTFTICKGANMTAVQTEIFNRICKLIGDTDVSKVTIPTCLKEAWESSDYEVLSILNLFDFILEQHCDLETQITNITNSTENLNPFVSVCLKCCEDKNGCTPTVSIKLSEALQKIVDCICEAKTRITALEQQVEVLECDLKEVKTVYDTFNNFINTQTQLNITNAQKFICINEGLNNLGQTTC